MKHPLFGWEVIALSVLGGLLSVSILLIMFVKWEIRPDGLRLLLVALLFLVSPLIYFKIFIEEDKDSSSSS